MIKVNKLKTEQAKEVEKKLENNDRYCPCCLLKTEDTKCMCKEFRFWMSQLQPGSKIICHCGLYEAVNSEDL